MTVNFLRLLKSNLRIWNKTSCLLTFNNYIQLKCLKIVQQVVEESIYLYWKKMVTNDFKRQHDTIFFFLRIEDSIRVSMQNSLEKKQNKTELISFPNLKHTCEIFHFFSRWTSKLFIKCNRRFFLDSLEIPFPIYR